MAKQITKEELRDIYINHTNEEAAKILGITVPTLLKYVKLADLKLKGVGSHHRKPKIKIT